MGKFKSFIIECGRVLKITKKPDAFEFKTIVKVSGLGILVIGLIGFLLTIGSLSFIFHFSSQSSQPVIAYTDSVF